MIRCRHAQLIFGLGAGLFLSACSGEKMGVVAVSSAALEAEDRGAIALYSLTGVPVDPFFAEGVPPYRVLSREERIRQYPCSTCHRGPIEEQPLLDTKRDAAHPNLVLSHADAQTMDCVTCHDGANLDQLVSMSDEPIAFDHAYQVCASCHFQQVDDWAGGAHGKRIGGWRGERMVMNCTECHDPHAPAFDQRWPAKTPRIPRTTTAL